MYVWVRKREWEKSIKFVFHEDEWDFFAEKKSNIDERSERTDDDRLCVCVCVCVCVRVYEMEGEEIVCVWVYDGSVCVRERGIKR